MDVSTIIAAVIGGVVGWHLGDIVFGVKGKGSVKGAPKEDKAEKGQNEAQDFHESEPNGMQGAGYPNKGNKENREQQAANAELAVNPFPARRMLRNVWPGRGFAYHSVEEKDKSRSYGADDQVFYDVI